MSRETIWIVLCSAAWLAASPQIARSAEPPRPCGPRLVTKTILVPQIAYKVVDVPVLALLPRIEQKTVTVLRDVPEERTVTRQVRIVVPEEQTETETFTECRLVEEEVERDVTVWQPRTEVQAGTRSSSRAVMVEETRTVSKDVGGWREKRWIDAHGCPRRCRVWVPKIVAEQISLTVPRLEAVETPFREAAVVWAPETRTITERVCQPVYETKTREVTRTICVERLVEREVTEVSWRRESEEQVVNFLVPEAMTEHRELLAAERTLVPRSIKCVICCER